MIAVVIVAIGCVLAQSAASSGWRCDATPIEPCFTHHGRITSQNGIASKIWLIGTTWAVGLDRTELPAQFRSTWIGLRRAIASEAGLRRQSRETRRAGCRSSAATVPAEGDMAGETEPGPLGWRRYRCLVPPRVDGAHERRGHAPSSRPATLPGWNW
jgi:hypothetical protein